MSADVNWLIKGTLAVVTVTLPRANEFNDGLGAQYLMGPDGHEVLGTCRPTHPASASVWIAWIRHPDTINEARDAWKKAAAAECEPTGCSHCAGSTIEPGSMFGAGSCHRCRR